MGTMDVVVGTAGDCALFLSDLSYKQLTTVYQMIVGTESDKKLNRSIMEEVVSSAVVKGKPVTFTTAQYLWCTLEGPDRPRRISLWICRERQRSGERCPRSRVCEHKLENIKQRKRSFKMAKKKEGQEEPKEPRVTKTSLLRKAFEEASAWTKEALLEKTGYDERNLRTAIHLLKDPERTKQPITIKWFAEEKLFKLIPDAA